MGERLLTYAEAAERLTVSARTLARLVAAGRIRTVPVSKRRRAITEREVEAYIAARRRAA